MEVELLSTQGSEAACTLTVMNELSHQVIVGMPWLRKGWGGPGLQEDDVE